MRPPIGYMETEGIEDLHNIFLIEPDIPARGVYAFMTENLTEPHKGIRCASEYFVHMPAEGLAECMGGESLDLQSVSPPEPF